MTTSNIHHIVPLFDPQKWEKATQCPHDVKLFLEGEKPDLLEGNWLPKDTYGGLQCNLAIYKQVI